MTDNGVGKPDTEEGVGGTDLKPVKPISTLEDAQLLLEEALGILEPVGVNVDELATPEARAVVAKVERLVHLVRQRALAALPEVPFRPSAQVVPSPEANHFIGEARRGAEEKLKTKNELVQRTVFMLETVLGSKISGLIPLGRQDEQLIDESDPRKRAIKGFAEKYATESGLDINMVIEHLSNQTGEFYVGLQRPQIEAAFRDDRVRDLVSDPSHSVFRSGVLPSRHFEELVHVKVAALVMDIQRAWHSRRMETGENDRFLAELMGKAKQYIGDTFGFDFLGVELSKCKSLPELQEFARVLPVDKGSYDLLRKAHLFLKVMHIMLLHASEVDESAYFDNSRNLRAEMDDFCVCRGDGCYVNPPRTADGRPIVDFVDDLNGMGVDRVEVAEGKPLHSTIDKIFRKGLYDTTEIGDFARMRVFLRKEDCYDEGGSFNVEKTEAALEKLLGIIIARFGNDIDIESLDYSVASGKTNEASKGAHRGIHFNFKYKSACNANGLTPDGEPKTKAIDVEVQLLAYMPGHEYEEDHRKYQTARKKMLSRELGFDGTFDTFVLDLISALSNDKYEFEFRSLVDDFSDIEDLDEEFRKVYERQHGIGDKKLFPEDVDLPALIAEHRVLFSQDKLRLFVLLLTILTAKESDGSVANAALFDYMESYFPGKIHRLVNQYSRLLRTSAFYDGGEFGYLKRVLEAKMQFITVIANDRRGSKKGVSSRQCFDVHHVMKVGNCYRRSRGEPVLTMITCFDGGKGKRPLEMELPYDGPIGLVGEPSGEVAGGGKPKATDFYWKLKTRELDRDRGPVYRIEQEEDGNVVCYLLADQRRGVVADEGMRKLPIWILQPDYDSGGGEVLLGRYILSDGILISYPVEDQVTQN